jgi:hypothetical protein|nr:hypothetical protein Q903MT_gene368 [Picea sitchensis]
MLSRFLPNIGLNPDMHQGYPHKLTGEGMLSRLPAIAFKLGLHAYEQGITSSHYTP